MNSIKYLAQGIELGDSIFNRFNLRYTQDKVQVTQASQKYEGKVTKDTEENRGGVFRTIILDSAVEIKTVLSEVRTPKLNFWNKRSIECLVLGISGIGLGIAGAAAACTAGSFVVGNAVIAVTVVGVAVAVSGVGLAILGFYRKSQADEQYQAWQNPLATYQEQRKRAGTERFSYVFSQQLKGKVIHPDECRQLWLDWANRDMPIYQKIQEERHNSPQQIAKIKQFFQSNPLDADAMKYAFEGVTPAEQNIQDLSVSFNQVKLAYADVRVYAEQKRTNINAEKTKLIKENEVKRNAWLAPAKLVKNTMIKKAKQQIENNIKELKTQLQQEYRKSLTKIRASTEITEQQKVQSTVELQDFYKNHPSLKPALEEYDSKCEKYKLLYQVITAPIHLQFDDNKRKIENWAKKQIDQVNEKEHHQIGQFIGNVQGIAQAYVDMTNYNIAQAGIGREKLLYPDLSEYQNMNEAYIRLPAFNPELTADEVNEFYNQIHQSTLPSAPIVNSDLD